jgi:hypothetical protein
VRIVQGLVRSQFDDDGYLDRPFDVVVPHNNAVGYDSDLLLPRDVQPDLRNACANALS